MTIAMISRQVYEDFSKLDVSKTYLYGSMGTKLAPIAKDAALISMFYTMILYFNSGSGKFTAAELLSSINCLLIVAEMPAPFYGLYCFTLSCVCRNLRVKK